MGDLTRNRSSPPLTSASAAAAPPLCVPAVPGPAGDAAGTAPGTMISAEGLGAATTVAVPGFFSRMRKSPREYSNSSRLCSLMKRSNCSICPISGLANDPLSVVFDGFFRFMPILKFDEIPRDAGQHFTAPNAYCHIIFYTNATHTLDIHTRFYGNHISRLKSNRLPPS